MDRMNSEPQAGDPMLGALTPEKVRRARARIAAVREDMRQRGVDPAHLPDPVDELVKARDAGGWD